MAASPQSTFYVRDRFPCPLCGAQMFIRTSRQLSNVLREQYWFCTSVSCDGKFKAIVELVSQLSAGSYDVGLKIPRSMQKQALAQPRPAPDPNQLGLPGLELDLSCYQGSQPSPAAGPPG